MSPGAYRYAQLSEDCMTRLFTVHPAYSEDDDLQCELIEYDLSSSHEYEALSYVWGTDSLTEVLYLPGGFLKITASLAVALRRLRLPERPRILWVDAVCIDQKDDLDKARQVARMARIYRCATKVIAWLGQDSRHPLDTEAIVSLSQRAKEIGLRCPKENNSEIFRQWLYGDKERFLWTQQVPKATESANFPRVYGSSWFTRMWIVQEALLAKHLTLYLGSSTLEWDDFERTMVLVHSINECIRLPVLNQDLFRNAWSLIEVRNYWIRSSLQNSSEMEDILFYTYHLRRRDCKDDRDRIFALRGILGDYLLDIRPDYRKTVAQVYIELARKLLRHGHIEVLYSAGLYKRRAFQVPENYHVQTNPALWSNYLPTWAPDYRRETTYLEADPRFGDKFGRDERIPPSFGLCDAPYRLTTQATLVDIITFVQPALFAHYQWVRADHVTTFMMMRQFCKELKAAVDTRLANNDYPGGGDRVAAFAHALVGGGTGTAYRSRFEHNFSKIGTDPLSLWKLYETHCIDEDGEVYQAVVKDAAREAKDESYGGLSMGFYSNASADGSKAWEYCQHLGSIFRRHAFFITDDGYIGLAPLKTQSGGTDSIAFIDGANMPFVLRDLGENSTDWILIGPCYAHGIMDGEMVKRSEAFSAGTINLI